MGTSLPLPLLVARVRADHHDPPVPADRLAPLAHPLDRRTNLHLSRLLPVPVHDPAPGQIVRRELHQDPVSGEDPDVVHPHLPRYVSQDPVSSSTRNMALGRGSTTVPSTSMASFFATLLPSW